MRVDSLLREHCVEVEWAVTGGGETRSPGRAGQTLHAVEAGGGEGEGTRAIASDWSFVQCPLILLQFQPFLSTGTDMS